MNSTQRQGPFDRLIAAIVALPQRTVRPPTLLEIAGYPHLENVASNILRFFLDPAAHHGLGPLCLNELAGLLALPPIVDGERVQVRREEPTPEGKRIDLVIESDAWIIGIENKIYAALYNNLAIYRQHIGSLARERTVAGAVLALTTPKTPPTAGFIPITYTALAAKLRQALARDSAAGVSVYRLHLEEFLTTMDHLHEEAAMDEQRLTFFREHGSAVERLLQETDQLRKQLRARLEALADAIDHQPWRVRLGAHGFWRSPAWLGDILHYQLQATPDLFVQMDLILKPAGWSMQFFGSRGSIEQVRTWLESCRLDIVLQTRPARVGVAKAAPAVDAPLDAVVAWVAEVVKHLEGAMPMGGDPAHS